MGSDPTPNVQALLNDYVSRKPAGVAVSAGIVSPDVPTGQAFVPAGGANLVNTAHQPMQLTPATPFEIGSITKIFTLMAAFFFGGGGENYSGVLGDGMPAVDLPSGLSNLPIIDLANYSPGFPTDNSGGWWGSGVTDTLPHLLDFLQKGKSLPQQTPGTYYSYSNFGWSLLALVALNVESKDEDVAAEWAGCIRRLRGYVGMTGATAPFSSALRRTLPVGFDKEDQEFSIDADYQPTAPMLFGAGDLVSDGNDMMAWLKWNMGVGYGLSAMFKTQQLKTWQLPQYPPTPGKGPVVSLGWVHASVAGAGGRVTRLSKDGGVRGFTSWMGFQSWVQTTVPSPIGCFVLTNSHGANDLGRDIFSILIGNDPADRAGAGDVAPEAVDYVTPPGVEG